MSASRFLTASEVYAAFPQMTDVISVPGSSASPPAFMRSLAASGTPEDAVTFCAFALGRREAVWWACQCVREMMGDGSDDQCLQAAENWVREPEEDLRKTALELGMGADRAAPQCWLALAAGWSGGTIAPASPVSVPPAPHLTATAVRAAVLIALARVPVTERARGLERCVTEGLRMIEPATQR